MWVAKFEDNFASRIERMENERIEIGIRLNQ